MARIDLLERFRLGNWDQWALLRGDAAGRRVLLYLHGGPGAPVFPLADEIDRIAPELGSCFVTVFWEQRGTGKSNGRGLPPESMSIDQLVRDAIELATALTRRFNVPRVHLMGHSWGSIVGALAAARRPDLFAAYIGAAQVTNFAESERLSYAWALEAARRRKHRRALAALKRIGPPPHGVEQMIAERKWIVRLGGNRRHRPRGRFRTFLAAAANPAYSWRDVYVLLADPYFSLRHLLPQMQECDLFRQAPRLLMPVYLLAGSHDGTVPSSLVGDYFDALEAPAGKTYVTFEHSAHVPFLEEPGKFERLMCETVAAHA